MNKLGIISIKRLQIRNTNTWNLILIQSPVIPNKITIKISQLVNLTKLECKTVICSLMQPQEI